LYTFADLWLYFDLWIGILTHGSVAVIGFIRLATFVHRYQSPGQSVPASSEYKRPA